MTCGLDLMCWLPKNRGFLHPKMDGENNGSKPYEQMDDLGGFWKHPYISHRGNCQEALVDHVS